MDHHLWWKLVTFIYELSTVLAVLIWFLFWTVVLPFMIWGPEFKEPVIVDEHGN
jgi:hypothetical protein